MEKVKEIRKTFTTILRKPEMQILPGQIAFYLLMSIIPIVALTAIAASYITKSFNYLDIINTVMPDALAKILIALSNNMQLQGVAFILLLYIFVGSNAPSSIIIASNMLYEHKQPSYIRLKTKAFIMTIMIAFLLLFVILIPLCGDLILKVVLQLFDVNLIGYYAIIYQVIKIIVSWLIIYTIIKLLYTMAPDKRIKSKTTTKGTIFTTISWIIATYLFSFYITNIAKYDAIYGNFANILILLIWVWFLAYLFVIGMAINVDSYQKQGMCSNEKTKKERGKKIKEEN